MPHLSKVLQHENHTWNAMEAIVSKTKNREFLAELQGDWKVRKTIGIKREALQKY